MICDFDLNHFLMILI